jgi:hypothetical protein
VALNGNTTKALGLTIPETLLANASQKLRNRALYMAHVYHERNNNLNPDFPLGGDKWKTNKLKRAPHHGSVNPRWAKAESQPRQARTTVE